MANNQTVSREVMLLNVRLSFPELWTAKHIVDPKTKQPTGEAKFRATFLLDKEQDKEQIRSIWNILTEMMKERYGANMTKAAMKHWPLRDGAEKPDIEGYGDGVMFIAANSTRRPIVVDRFRNPVVETDKQAPYSGCYVNAMVQFWTQEYMGGKQINTGLNVVQFWQDGQAFSGVKADLNQLPCADGSGAPTGDGGAIDDCPV
jgi:hypothetical protein